MANDPVSTAFALLFNTLNPDVTLASLVTGIFQHIVPVGVQPDWLLLIHQSSQDTNSATGVRILTTMLFQVKAVGPETDAVNIHAAYARADALLQPNGQPLRNAGGTLALFREQTFSLGELVNGVTWLNHGGLYRIEV